MDHPTVNKDRRTAVQQRVADSLLRAERTRKAVVLRKQKGTTVVPTDSSSNNNNNTDSTSVALNKEGATDFVAPPHPLYRAKAKEHHSSSRPSSSSSSAKSARKDHQVNNIGFSRQRHHSLVDAGQQRQRRLYTGQTPNSARLPRNEALETANLCTNADEDLSSGDVLASWAPKCRKKDVPPQIVKTVPPQHRRKSGFSSDSQEGEERPCFVDLVEGASHATLDFCGKSLDCLPTFQIVTNAGNSSFAAHKLLKNATRSLLLRNNSISRLENLAWASKLQALDLSHNHLKGQPFTEPLAMAALNSISSSLKELHLSHNSITSLRGLAVLKKTLRKLDVSNNRIGPTIFGAEPTGYEIEALVFSFPALEDLNLEGNSLSGDNPLRLESRSSVRAAKTADSSEGDKMKFVAIEKLEVLNITQNAAFDQMEVSVVLSSCLALKELHLAETKASSSLISTFLRPCDLTSLPKEDPFEVLVSRMKGLTILTLLRTSPPSDQEQQLSLEREIALRLPNLHCFNGKRLKYSGVVLCGGAAGGRDGDDKKTTGTTESSSRTIDEENISPSSKRFLSLDDGATVSPSKSVEAILDEELLKLLQRQIAELRSADGAEVV